MAGVINTGSGSYSSSSLFSQSCGTSCYSGTLALSQYLADSYLVNNYSTTIIPKASTGGVTVNVLVSLTSLLGLSNTGTLSVLLTLLLSWTDHELQWEASQYSGVSYLYVSASSIWTPTLTVVNPTSGSTTTSVTFTDKAYLAYDGTVQVIATVEVDTVCNLDLNLFPFDTQTCSVLFVDYLYSTSDLNFYVYSVNASTGDYSNNSNWERQYTTVAVSNESIIFNVQGTEYVTFSMLNFTIGVARNSYYYVANLIVPSILMIVLVALVFILPADSGEKVSYAATLSLALYVLQQVISAIVPSSNSLPNLSVAILFSFSLSTLACVTSVISVLLRTLNGDLELETQLYILSRFSVLAGRSASSLEKFIKQEIERQKEKENGPKSVSNGKNESSNQKPQVQSENLIEYLKLLNGFKAKSKRNKKRDEALETCWELVDYLFNLVSLLAYLIISGVYIGVYMFN